MNSNNRWEKILRWFLASIFLVFGINRYFPFLALPPIEGQAGQLIQAMIASGYLFQIVKVFEFGLSFLLLLNWKTPLVLILLAPISLNIFLFHLFLHPIGLPLGIIILSLHIALFWFHSDRYFSIWKK